MEADKHKKITNSLYVIASIFSIAGLVILIIFLVSLGKSYSVFGDNPIELDKTAQVGDFIGGLVGSLWSFAGIILFFLALLLQMKEFKAQREELTLQRKELRNQRNEFKLNRITNIIYKQTEIVHEKLNRVNLKAESQKIDSYGVNAIRDFHFKARLWIGGKTTGDLLTEKERENLLEFYLFPMTGEFQDFSFTIQSSLNLLINLITEGNKLEEIEKSEVHQFYQIINSNFYLDELFHYFTEEEIVYKMNREYNEFKNKKKQKVSGGDLMLQKRRDSILRMIKVIKSK